MAIFTSHEQVQRAVSHPALRYKDAVRDIATPVLSNHVVKISAQIVRSFLHAMKTALPANVMQESSATVAVRVITA